MTAPSPDQFDPLVGETFTVTGPWGPALEGGPDRPTPTLDAAGVVLRLKKVHRLDFPGPYEQFRLTFTGPSDRPLDQGTYVLDRADPAVEAYFLVPSSDDGTTRTYEAGFTVPRDASEASA